MYFAMTQQYLAVHLFQFMTIIVITLLSIYLSLLFIYYNVIIFQ